MRLQHLVIVGPTASGKTKLSIEAAQLLNAEIICADSRTVYVGMDIGTAKPTQQEQALVRHHCLDIVRPDEPFTVADFVGYAQAAKGRIEQVGKRVVTVGGSGLFVDGFVYAYSFSPPNKEVREKYQSYTIERLQDELVAKEISLPTNAKNKRHLLLALERQGVPPSTRQSLPKGTVIIGINPPKEVLFARIEKRAISMLEDGVAKEVAKLYAHYGDQRAFLGGAYSALRPYLCGDETIEQALNSMIAYDKRLAKRQLTWFKRNPDITWFTSAEDALVWLKRQERSTL